MKRLFLTIALTLTAFTGSFAQDLYFGVKGGISGNWIPKTTINPDDKVLPNIGFYGGAIATYEFAGDLFLQGEVLYARKGISTKGETFNNKYWRRLHYLQVPLLIGAKLGDERFRLMAGPEFGFCLGNKVYEEVAMTSPATADNVKSFNFALAVQTSYMILDQLGVDFKMDYGLSKTFTNNDDGRNLCVQIGVSYLFGY